MFRIFLNPALKHSFAYMDRILSVVSAFALAIATNRTLAVDWGSPFESLFQSPTFGWGMDLVK